MKMNVSDYTLEFIADQGIRDVFMIFGGSFGGLADAFHRNKRLNIIYPLHEQGGGFAAEGYMKISGKPSAMMVTSGPGAQNLVTPIGNFYYDSIPGIFFSGQVPSGFLRPNKEVRQVGFQEAPTTEILKPITKYTKMITDPNTIKFELQKAFYHALEGRQGPVLLDMPSDIQEKEIDPAKLQSFTPPENTPYDLNEIDNQIDKIVDGLKHSERPAILIGGGVRLAGAVDKVWTLEETLKLPFFPTWNATDVITDDSTYFGGRPGTYGGKGRNLGIQNSDWFLGIGTRLSGRVISGGRPNDFARAARKYVVDIDKPTLNSHQVPLVERVHSDANLFLDRLFERLEGEKLPDFSEWNQKVFEWRDKYDPVKPEYINTKGFVHTYYFMRALSQEMHAGDIIVGDCGGNIIAANHAFETKKGQRTITNNGNSPMGFSFAGAIGAWFASDKNHNVVCTIGDGGFNMNIQELHTIKKYDAKTKTFILDNNCYGLTRQTQRKSYDGRIIANDSPDYTHPKFEPIAEAYGVKAFTLTEPSQARHTIKEVLKHEGPAICVVYNGNNWDNYEPRVYGAMPLEDQHPQLPRDEFRANMIVPPLPGWEDGSYKK
jgi:acetolactate synthase I/II/III large subunit